MTKKSAGIITMGCPKNVVDSEKLAAMLVSQGIEVAHEVAGEDFIIINTCGFINDAKEESINEILQQAARKQQEKALKVIVTGCLSERYREQLMAEIPEIDFIAGTHDYEKVAEYISGNIQAIGTNRLIATPKHYAYVKISEGCSHVCSFCAIPAIRGKHISVPQEQIVDEARQLAAAGVKELIVIAQDTISYGLDLYGERRIALLLRELSAIDGLERIRLMYTHPAGFPDDLIEEIAANPKICKYIDIPLQHISDSILSSMKRGIDYEATKALLKKLRERIPGVAIRSTFIVGYPGEKAMDFSSLKKFVMQEKFERFGVFAYSAEEGTSAAEFVDDVPHALKMKRMSELLRIHERNAINHNEQFVGKRIKVIVDDFVEEENEFLCRTEFDAPDIDNIVRLQKKVTDKICIGDLVEVKITAAGLFDLEAELV